MKNKQTIFIAISCLLYLLILIYFYFGDYLRSDKYGKTANFVRVYVNIPIIENDMTKVVKIRGVDGGKWEAKSSNNTLTQHLWKIVSPNSGKYLLDKEIDMFRKYLKGNKTYWQLNMSSKIIGDSISIRKGTLGFYDDTLINEIDLDEGKLDSLFSSWGLNNLIKKQVTVE